MEYNDGSQANWWTGERVTYESSRRVATPVPRTNARQVLSVKRRARRKIRSRISKKSKRANR